MRAMSTNPEARERRGSTGACRWLVLACLLGCDAPPERADPEATPPPTRAPPPTAPPPPAAPPRASASAPAPAAPTAPGDLSGSWTGSYDAKKGTVGLPPKVKDKALAA